MTLFVAFGLFLRRSNEQILFLFNVIPDRHECESEIEHDRKGPRESEIDGVQSFQVLDEDQDKADGEKSKAQLGFGRLVHIFFSSLQNVNLTSKRLGFWFLNKGENLKSKVPDYQRVHAGCDLWG